MIEDKVKFFFETGILEDINGNGTVRSVQMWFFFVKYIYTSTALTATNVSCWNKPTVQLQYFMKMVTCFLYLHIFEKPDILWTFCLKNKNKLNVRRELYCKLIFDQYLDKEDRAVAVVLLQSCLSLHVVVAVVLLQSCLSVHVSIKKQKGLEARQQQSWLLPDWKILKCWKAGQDLNIWLPIHMLSE